MDKNYWDNYYEKHGRDNGINYQSSFADFCQNNFFKSKAMRILELGSGNGRDSLFFASKGHSVVALDQSITGIELEKSKISVDISKDIIIKATNFVTEDYSEYGHLDAFYSRFTIHSITSEEESIVTSKVFNKLATGGIFCIEVRTVKDQMFGKGESLGDNAYRTDHYRRFIETDKFVKNMLSLGFKLRYFTEEDNLSIYKDDNPVLMRIILEK